MEVQSPSASQLSASVMSGLGGGAGGAGTSATAESQVRCSPAWLAGRLGLG